MNIQQIDKLYVDVTQASSEFLRLKEALANGKLKADASGKAQVQLILEDGRVYPDEGTLEVSDVTVNAATNTVTVRAISPNPAAICLLVCSCERGWTREVRRPQSWSQKTR